MRKLGHGKNKKFDEMGFWVTETGKCREACQVRWDRSDKALSQSAIAGAVGRCNEDALIARFEGPRPQPGEVRAWHQHLKKVTGCGVEMGRYHTRLVED